MGDTCDSEPLDKPWKKYCSDKQDDMNNFIERKGLSKEEEEVRSQDISGKKVFLFNDFDERISSESEKSKKHEKLSGKEARINLSTVEKELIELVKVEGKLIQVELNVIKQMEKFPTNVNVNV